MYGVSVNNSVHVISVINLCFSSYLPVLLYFICSGHFDRHLRFQDYLNMFDYAAHMINETSRDTKPHHTQIIGNNGTAKIDRLVYIYKSSNSHNIYI